AAILQTIEENDYQLSASQTAQFLSHIHAVLGTMAKHIAEQKAEEKRLARLLLWAATQMLIISQRHIRTVAIFLKMATGYLQIRRQNTEAVIARLQQTRLKPLRIDAEKRNKDITSKAKSIVALIRRKDFSAARLNILGMRDRNDIKAEPDLVGFHPALSMALAAVDRKDAERAILIIEWIIARVANSNFLHPIMAGYRDELVKRELTGDQPVDREALLTEIFLKFVACAQIIRGSPYQRALWWARLYCAARIPLNIQNPEKKSQRIPNPAFKAAQKYISLLEAFYTKASLRLRWVRSPRFSQVRELLSAFNRQSKHLLREDLCGLAMAIAEVYELTEADSALLKKMVWQESRDSSSPAAFNDLTTRGVEVLRPAVKGGAKARLSAEASTSKGRRAASPVAKAVIIAGVYGAGKTMLMDYLLQDPRFRVGKWTTTRDGQGPGA
ncbi:MAG: hypothetical protein ACOY3D_00715, partial [Candidatus Omnitrophota bacterium]